MSGSKNQEVGFYSTFFQPMIVDNFYVISVFSTYLIFLLQKFNDKKHTKINKFS